MVSTRRIQTETATGAEPPGSFVFERGGFDENPWLRLEVLAGFEPDGLSGRDIGNLSGTRIPADSALARFYYEHAEAPKLDSFSALESGFHSFEQ